MNYERDQKVIIYPVMPGLDDIAGKIAIVKMRMCKDIYLVNIISTGESLHISSSELKAYPLPLDELLQYMDH